MACNDGYQSVESVALHGMILQVWECEPSNMGDLVITHTVQM